MSGTEKKLWYRLIDVQDGRHGKMAVAAGMIGEGAVIMRFTGKPMNYSETLGQKDESFALQVNDDEYIYLDKPFRFINHSCEPNCGVTPDLHLVALVNIAEGEELTYDYSTTMSENSWEMTCSCRSKTCRGTVRDFNTLPLHLQNYYAGRNVVQEFILKKKR